MRVATWNIHAGVGIDGRLDLERVAEMLRLIDADAVGLQEVDDRYSPRSDFADQTALLAAELGMSGVFAPALHHPDGGGYGVALLTKGVVGDHEVVELPWTDDGGHGERRVCLRASYGGVQLLVTHLQWRPAADRGAQWARVTQLVTPETVVLADVNDDPAELARSAGLVDAGREAGFTWRADRLRSRIDAVLTTAGLEASGAHTLRTLASDHVPLVVDLS